MNSILRHPYKEFAKMDVVTRPVPRRSILSVFGDNLRMLTTMRGSQSHVAADLDIGRVQFQRYLRGESFPKPNLLNRICEYFGVDARILTEPLSESLLHEMTLRQIADGQNRYWREWMAGLTFAAQDQNYFNAPQAPKVGTYAVWHWSEARSRLVVRLRVRIFEQGGVSLLRGYNAREALSPGVSARERQFRGLGLALRDGSAFMIFHNKPSETFATWFMSPTYIAGHYSDVSVGFAAVCRNELPNAPRFSRLVLERIDTSPRHLVQEAHTPSYFELSAVPEAIRGLLAAPTG